MPKHPFFGSTGRFPQGKIHPSDEGELRFGVTHRSGNVILEFGKPIEWLGLPPAMARELASVLILHAGKVEKETR